MEHNKSYKFVATYLFISFYLSVRIFLFIKPIMAFLQVGDTSGYRRLSSLIRCKVTVTGQVRIEIKLVTDLQE